VRKRIITLGFFFFFQQTNASEIIGYKNIGSVLTPSKIEQSIANSPSSVTVITRSQIDALGIKNIPEIMRLVPGFSVGRLRGNDYRISSHGGHINARRIELMIDGRSQFRPGTDRIDWQHLPVSIKDIERVEISRTTSTVNYGTNAFMAVVNIITTNSIESAGIKFNITEGSSDYSNKWLRAGVLQGTNSHTLSVSSDRETPFELLSDLFRDAVKVDRITYSSNYLTDDLNSFGVRLGYSDSEPFFPGLDGVVTRQYDSHEGKKYYLQLNSDFDTSDNSNFKMHLYARRETKDEPSTVCLPAAYLLPELGSLYTSDPRFVDVFFSGASIPADASPDDLALLASLNTTIASVGIPSALTRVCGSVAQTTIENQYEFKIDHTLTFNEKLRMGTGLGLRRDDVECEVFLNGDVKLNNVFVWNTIEYIPQQDWVINFGSMAENRGNDTETSFKLGVVKKIDNASVRYILAKSHRMPGLFSQYGDWSYSVSNLSPVIFEDSGQFFISAQSTNDLEPESLVSNEIGFRVESNKFDSFLDIRLFQERLYNLISERLVLEDFNPTNNGSLKSNGVEIEYSLNVNGHTDIRLTYGYLDSETDATYESMLDYQHTGSASIIFTGIPTWVLSTGIYSTDNSIGTYYDRYDFNAQKRLNDNITLFGQLSYYSNRDSILILNIDAITSSDRFYNYLDSEVQTMVGISIDL